MVGSRVARKGAARVNVWAAAVHAQTNGCRGAGGKGAARYMGVPQTVRGCDSKREGREDAGCMGAGARERADHPRGGKKGREKRGGEERQSVQLG